MKLILAEHRLKLLANWQDEDTDHAPVIKLFTPWGGATWLISEMKAEEPDILFGLCDLGMGAPELGYVSLSEIEAVQGPAFLTVERDRFFEPKASISVYADAARLHGHIVEDGERLERAYEHLNDLAKKSGQATRAQWLAEREDAA